MADSPTTARPRILVDPRLCEAHALCIDLAPAVFVLGDDIAACTENPDEKDWADIEAAIAACPRQAITVIEAPESSNNERP